MHWNIVFLGVIPNHRRQVFYNLSTQSLASDQVHPAGIDGVGWCFSWPNIYTVPTVCILNQRLEILSMFCTYTAVYLSCSVTSYIFRILQKTKYIIYYLSYRISRILIWLSNPFFYLEGQCHEICKWNFLRNLQISFTSICLNYIKCR